jgi:hypothetical protein
MSDWLIGAGNGCQLLVDTSTPRPFLKLRRNGLDVELLVEGPDSAGNAITFPAAMTTGTGNEGPIIKHESASGRNGYDFHIYAQNTDVGHMGGALALHSGTGFDSYGVKILEGELPICYFFAENGSSPQMRLAPAGASTFDFRADNSTNLTFLVGGREVHDATNYWIRSWAGTVGSGTVPNWTVITTVGLRLGPDSTDPTERLEVEGNEILTGFLQLSEASDPAAPAANKARVYCRDNGAGKSQLVVRFPSGAVQIIATEP